MLVERWARRTWRSGANFRFGHKAAGDAAMLEADERFETTIHALVEVEGEIGVLQPHPRPRARRARSRTPAVFLGRPFQVRGEVVHGDGRGSELGFPTANLVPDERLVRPDHGVYAALADGAARRREHRRAPHFETGRGVLIEAYLIDFDGDLYGRELRIDFLAASARRALFPSVETLTEQIDKDVQQAREICARHAA